MPSSRDRVRSSSRTRSLAPSKHYTSGNEYNVARLLPLQSRRSHRPEPLQSVPPHACVENNGVNAIVDWSAVSTRRHSYVGARARARVEAEGTMFVVCPLDYRLRFVGCGRNRSHHRVNGLRPSGACCRYRDVVEFHSSMLRLTVAEGSIVLFAVAY